MIKVTNIGWTDATKTRFIVKFDNGTEIHKDTFLDAKESMRKLVFAGKVCKDSWKKAKENF